jgi:hypothetical protein
VLEVVNTQVVIAKKSHRSAPRPLHLGRNFIFG